MQTSARDDDRRYALHALLARLETYEAPPAFHSDPDPQVGDFDHDAWEQYCLARGLADFEDRRMADAWTGDLRYADPDEHADAGLAERPTGARPASPAKVLEMMERANRSEELFHPCDAPADDPSTAAQPLFATNGKTVGREYQDERRKKAA